MLFIKQSWLLIPRVSVCKQCKRQTSRLSNLVDLFRWISSSPIYQLNVYQQVVVFLRLPLTCLRYHGLSFQRRPSLFKSILYSNKNRGSSNSNRLYICRQSISITQVQQSVFYINLPFLFLKPLRLFSLKLQDLLCCNADSGKKSILRSPQCYRVCITSTSIHQHPVFSVPLLICRRFSFLRRDSSNHKLCTWPSSIRSNQFSWRIYTSNIAIHLTPQSLLPVLSVENLSVSCI
jgi:hypothetical protein